MPVLSTTRAQAAAEAQDTKHDRRLGEILDFATEVFAERGYGSASIRDLSRLSGISLAGLYYYFESKEKLLYLIQRHTFTTILERLRSRLATSTDPEERIRIFVENHVDYALAKPKAMKVLSHEDDVLKNSFGAEVAGIKREYYRTCLGLVEEFAKSQGLKLPSVRGRSSARPAVMALFGMMNWLYTWYSPEVDPDAPTLAHEFVDIFLQGIRGGRLTQPKARALPNGGKNSSKRVGR